MLLLFSLCIIEIHITLWFLFPSNSQSRGFHSLNKSMKKERKRKRGKKKGRQGGRKWRKGRKEKSLQGKTILKSGGDTFPSVNGQILFYLQRPEGLGVIPPLTSFPSRDVKTFYNTSDNTTRNGSFIPKAEPLLERCLGLFHFIIYSWVE